MQSTRTSIRRKLVASMLLASGIALFVTTGFFMFYDILALRNGLRQNVATLGKVIAANSTAALVFQDRKDAQQILSGLRAEPEVNRAALYNADGQLMAWYPEQAAPAEFPRYPQEPDYRFEKGFLIGFEPVVESSGPVGTLYLRSDLNMLNARIRLYLIVAGAVLLGSLLLSFVLATRLQRRVSAPILALMDTARSVSQERDYTVRAPKVSEDEIGLLTDAFNQMLAQIQETNQALIDSAERLRLALQASRTGTWDWNIKTNKVTWDLHVYALYGLRPGAFGGTFDDAMLLVHADDRQPVIETVHQALRERTEFSAEFRVVWPDGSVHTLVSRGKGLYNSAGEPVRMSGVTIDVTEGRRAEEARRLLAAIVESSDDAIIGKDLEGRIVSWNRGAERMLGYSAEEMIGHTVDPLLAPDRHGEEVEVIEKVRRGEIAHYETQRIRKDGTPIHISLTVSPIRDERGQIIGASSISRDITRRRLTEEENARLREELEQRVRDRTTELESANREMEAFTYSVAHDLRAPLRHMDAFANVLKSDFSGALDATAVRYIDKIVSSSQNMGRLVDDLLNLARVGRQELKKQLTSLNEVLDQVLEELKEETRGRDIKWQINQLPRVQCDPGLIRQVFANLLSNAVKYSRQRARAVIEVGSFEKDGGKVIFVRDNGVGFNMKYANKLFGVFQRLHRPEDFEGTGVGLAIVERIIRKHGGRIWVEAEVDKGATFFFTLS